MANKTINEITNVSTQANDDDLLVMWDKNRKKTVKIKDKDFNKNNQPKTLETPIEVNNIKETTVEGALGAINDKVKNFTAGVAFKGTRSAYNTAKLIPKGSDGHIPSGALVIITDEGKTYVTNGTGSSQTLELVANATFNGSHAQWNALTPAQKAMYNIVNFDDDEAIGLQISDAVEDGNMNPVTSNAVYDYVNNVETIPLTQNTGSQYTIHELKAIRTGNVVSVVGVVEVRSQMESIVVATGFPLPLVTQGTIKPLQFLLSGQRGGNVIGEQAVFIDKLGQLTIYTSNSGGNYFFSGTYIA